MPLPVDFPLPYTCGRNNDSMCNRLACLLHVDNGKQGSQCILCSSFFFEILKTIFFENHPFITGWPLSRQCEIPCSFSVFFIVLLCVCVYLCVILCIFVFLCDILLPPGVINDDYLTFPWRFVALSAALGMLSVTPIMPILVLLSVVGVIRNHILNI